jgi:hypothetical protein
MLEFCSLCNEVNSEDILQKLALPKAIADFMTFSNKEEK